MGFDAHVLKVLIASPGDTGRERDAIEKALHGWNNARAEREQIHLAPWRWELHAVPELGGSAQAIIDGQAVDACDVVIAVFNAYLGTATDDAASGTAHEIIRAHRAGKPVHVYFSNEPLPRETTPEELKRLNDFKAQMRSEGLLGEYSGVEDLQFKVRDAIEHDLKSLDLGKVIIRSGKADQARKVMSYRMSVSLLGPGTWRVKVHNHSTGPITDFKVRVSAVDSDGNEVPDGAQRSKEKIASADVFAEVIGDALSGSLRPVMGAGGALTASRALTPTIRPQFQDVLAAHMTDGFPSGLAPDEHALALYVLASNTSPVVRMEFRDEAGIAWSRTNDEEPVRIDR